MTITLVEDGIKHNIETDKVNITVQDIIKLIKEKQGKKEVEKPVSEQVKDVLEAYKKKLAEEQARKYPTYPYVYPHNPLVKPYTLGGGILPYSVTYAENSKGEHGDLSWFSDKVNSGEIENKSVGH